LASKASQARTAPGIVTAWALIGSSAVMPCASNQSIVAAAGALPEPFSAITSSEPAGA